MKRYGTKYLNTLTLLLILVTAHAGKALHTHPDAYYQALEQTRCTDARTTIVDDCPICHFHFFTCLNAQPLLLTTYFTLLGYARVIPQTRVADAHADRASLRAPPFSGTIR